MSTAKEKELEKTKEAWSNKRQKDLKLERQQHLISVLTEEDFKEIIGLAWRESTITQFSVSSEKYQLETLTGMNHGLLHPDLNKKKLTMVDVSFNRLRDINVFQVTNGFTALTVLMARRNTISTTPKLNLPSLLELNLSHNHLSTLPHFRQLPNLQVLIISHNKMMGSFESLQHNTKLKRVDLAYNKYELTPGQLSSALDALAEIKQLQNLRLYENPFVAYIKEYQVFVIKKLVSLQKLDNVEINSSIRNELTAREKELDKDLGNIEEYADILDDRREKFKAAVSKKSSHHTEVVRTENLPQFNTMIKLLDDVFEDSSALLESLRQLMTYGEVVMSKVGDESSMKNLLSNFWVTYGKSEDKRAAVDQFIELVIGVMERHDTSRRDLVDILGYLSCLPSEKLGFKCMELLGRLMSSSSESKAEVVDTLERVVVNKGLLSFETDTMTQYAEEMIHGLVSLLKITGGTADVGKVVAPLLPNFVETFTRSQSGQGTKTRGVQNSVKLLAYATDTESNAIDVASEELVKSCTGTLDNRSVMEDDNMQDVWLDLLKLAGNLVRYGPEPIFQQFVKSTLHVRIMGRMKAIRMEGQYLEQLDSTESKGNAEDRDKRNINMDAAILAKCIDFVLQVCERSPEILRECCHSYGVVKEITSLLKQHKQDPDILEAALRMVRKILENTDMYRDYASDIIQECSKFKPMLQYLDGKKYPDLFRDERDMVPLSSIPPDSIINRIFIAVIEIITFFAKREDDENKGVEEDLGQAEQVNGFLNNENREAVLLSLLVVPNDAVKFAVMKALDRASIEQLEMNELGLMVKFINRCQNIGAGQTEEILAKIVDQLRKIAASRHKRGDEFRQFKGTETLTVCYNLLMRNVRRPTFDEENETQKTDLSISIVKLFRTCSHYQHLQSFMRTVHIEETVSKILKLEQQLNSPLSRDVSIEQTWIGRSIVILMRCFMADSENSLARYHRVTFRILTRIADVLEGRTDGFNHNDDDESYNECCSMQALAHRECRMWSLKRAEKQLRYLDDNEYEDRKTEAQRFIDMDGIAKITSFLMDTRIKNIVSDIQTSLRKAEDELNGIRQEAKDKEAQLQEQGKEARDKDEIETCSFYADSDGEDGGDPDEESGRAMLMKYMQVVDDGIDEDVDTLFVSTPKNFEINEKLDEENFDTNIQNYVLAAFFRIIWSLIHVPPVDHLRTKTIDEMRKPRMAITMLALMKDRPLLSCNLGSKFLAIMTATLDVGVFGKAYKGNRIELTKLVVETIARKDGMSSGLVKLLRLAKDRPLVHREQQLCAEIARCMGMISRVVPNFEKDLFTECSEAQSEAVAKCIQWIIPVEILRLCIAMILYELQVDAGTDSNMINKEFVEMAYHKTGMKERATNFLARLIIRCPQRKYDVYEAFSSAQVFGDQLVRPSYMWALLGEVNLGNYSHFIDKCLPAWSHDPHDRVVQICLVEVSTALKSDYYSALLCIAKSRFIYLLRPSEAKPPYKNVNDGDRWDSSWEAVWPREPSVVWSHEYDDIRRIYRCFGTQMLAFDWYHPEEKKSLERRAKQGLDDDVHSHVPRKYAPLSDVVVFHREQDRERFIQSLTRLAAKDENEKSRQHLPKLNDPVMRKEVQDALNDTKSRILAATCAMPLQESLLRAGTSLVKAPHLFVLTEKQIMSFSIMLSNYVPPKDDNQCAFDEETFRPPGMGPIGYKTLDSSDHPDGVTEQDFIERHMYRLHGADMMTKVGHGDAPHYKVLSKDNQWTLPPAEVLFIEAQDQPDLQIKCSNGTCGIRFYDDAGRESWRRALAYYLTENVTKNGKQWGRAR